MLRGLFLSWTRSVIIHPGHHHSHSYPQVVAGAHHRLLEGGHQKRRIKSMEAHEDHNNPRFNNDVAIITVTEPFDFSDPNVQPIEMFLLEDAEIPAETVCNVTGWGLLYGDPFGRPPNALQWIQLPLVSAADCADEFSGDATITDGMVCAGSSGHTTCNVSNNIVVDDDDE